MMKVHILVRCEFCDGEAYVFVCKDVDAQGETYDRYRPCEMCHGSGNRAKWVGLRELSELYRNDKSLPKSQALTPKLRAEQAPTGFEADPHMSWDQLNIAFSSYLVRGG